MPRSHERKAAEVLVTAMNRRDYNPYIVARTLADQPPTLQKIAMSTVLSLLNVWSIDFQSGNFTFTPYQVAETAHYLILARNEHQLFLVENGYEKTVDTDIQI